MNITEKILLFLVLILVVLSTVYAVIDTPDDNTPCDNPVQTGYGVLCEETGYGKNLVKVEVAENEQ